MRTRGRSVDRGLLWLGIATWTATLGIAALSVWLRVASGAPALENRFGMNDASIVGVWVLQVACATVALAIVIRLPRNLVAWTLFGIGLCYAVCIAAVAYVFAAAVRPGDVLVPEAAWLAQVGAQSAGVLTFVFIVIYPELRPSGHRALYLITAYGVFVSALISLHPGPLFFWPSIDNPLGVGPRLDVDTTGNVVVIPALLGFGVLVTSLWVARRYRRSQGVERLQLKWFVSAAFVSLIGLVIVVTIGATGRAAQVEGWPLLLYSLALTLVPIAVGIAILRYHLYAIDRLINRAVVYGAVTALLVLVYVAMVIATSWALAGLTNQGATLAVALSTLTVAALFNPVRRRMQMAVDRRFFRSRYDAARTVESFAERLRRTVDLDELETEMLDVVARTVQPVASGVWLIHARATSDGYRQAVRA